MGTAYPWHYRILWIFVFVLATVPSTAHAQTNPTVASTAGPISPIQWTSSADGVTISWPNPSAPVSAAAALAQLPTMRYQGYELPMEIITVALPESGLIPEHWVDINTINSVAWEAAVKPAVPLQPLAIDWEQYVDPWQTPEAAALPTTPLFLLRQGNLHGQQIAVFAFSPIYQAAGTIELATTLSATIREAEPVSAADYSILATRDAAMSKHSRQVAAPIEFEPLNPDAARQAIQFHVTETGMQVVTGAQLSSAGFNLATLDPAQLQLNYNGQEVALEIEGIQNGRLNTDSTLRFYASTIGDRWNTTSIYWLTLGTSAGIRMATRDVAPAAATPRNSVLEEGVWQEPLLYDSHYPGYDQDHWFHQKLISSQANAATMETLAINITPQLPRVDGRAHYTVSVTTYVRGEHTMRLLANGTPTDITWNPLNSSGLQQDWQLAVTSTVKSNTIEVGLLDVALAGVQGASMLLDKVFWQQPVQLNLQEKGAHFTGVAGDWLYAWNGLPANYRLYDVTDAARPVRLTGATTAGFEDGPADYRYVVTGPGTSFTPTVVRHEPVRFNTITGSDAIYIAPSEFLESLELLLELRRDQGYTVVAVNVQDIYDAWSYGHISPTAIRTFLQYAYAHWTPRPYSVTLVGDGSWDPHQYEDGNYDTRFIPPYLANVDPFLGEAACENCYVQLHGDDPITGDDESGNFFSADMWLGRLSVKTAGELVDVIKKIITYESIPDVRLWQNRVVLVADNYRRVMENGDIVIDLAGDFAEHSNRVAELSTKAVYERLYYDPLADATVDPVWHYSDATQIHRTVLNTLSGGAGVVVYNGHSHQWQWAVTDESVAANPDYLLGLYDTDALSNRDKYFIGLSMTCLTGQFHKPATSGTVLDERMFLNPRGGAVAVWGPAGLSVAHGHDYLQRGFFEKLWSSPAGSLKIGELIEAGYVELASDSTAPQDPAKTFLLLGDPLTTARVYPDEIHGIYLPTISR